jgi:hypothetical protein
MIGAAVSLTKGAITVDRTATDYLFQSSSPPRVYHVRRTTDADLTAGLRIEFGMLIKTGTPVAFTLLGQLRGYYADYPHMREDEFVVPSPGDGLHLVPAFQMGARYVFPSLHIGK